MELFKQLPANAIPVFVGDLCDRGADSKSVVSFIKENNYLCVKGNHEDIMIGLFGKNARQSFGWMSDFVHWKNHNGGQQTLESYGIDSTLSSSLEDNILFQEHIAWMETLPVYLELDAVDKDGQRLLVSHSTAATGFLQFKNVPYSPLAQHQFEQLLMWERKPMPKKIPGFFNIYGHTPQRKKPTVREHFACIDGGVYSKHGEYGKMYALQFPEMVTFEQKNIDEENTHAST
jgi:serine/threonine protein phosphatase 1